MAGMRLEFAQFGDFDSFDILRSSNPMNVEALPSPLVAGLSTMYYIDTTVIEDETYYYRARVWRDGVSLVSDEVRAKAKIIDEYWGSVATLLHFDGGLTDEAGHIFTSNGATNFDTGVFGQCAIFTGNNYIFTLNGNDFDFLLGDFTVEQFVKFTGLPSNNVYAIAGNYANNDGWVFQLRDDEGEGSRLRFSIGDNKFTDRAWTPSLNTWYHLVATRQNGLVYIFVNGILLVGPSVLADNIQATTGNTLNIGALKYTSSVIQYFKGSVDELRITKGVARYTENFTPPDGPFLSN